MNPIATNSATDAIFFSHRAPHRGLIVALVLSFAAHGALYLTTPQFAGQWTPTKTISYDATLTPLTPETLLPASIVARAAPATSRPPRVKHISRPLPAKSEANFTPPENSIAVAANTAVPGAEGENPSDGTLNTPTTSTPESPTIPLKKTPDPVTPESANTSNSAPVKPLEPPALPASTTPTRIAPQFPERISIEYKMTSSIADGIANFKWTRKDGSYEIDSSIQATGFLVAALAGVIHQQSRGEITDEGLRPKRFSIRRGEGNAETADFERATKLLTFKGRGNDRSEPLTNEMQDMQSFLFQLAYDAPRLAETGDKLDVQTTNARKVYRYQFKKIGEETIDTKLGKLETIRLLADAPTPEDAYEVWLAPKYFYLPVKLKYYLGRFLFEQTVTRIGVSATPAPTPSTANAAKTAEDAIKTP